ncbi:MAG TPA: hypothetical protein VET89_04140 [Stellaceae bacterium]|nr:hypothetical protein [Stellaceae bacterium]
MKRLSGLFWIVVVLVAGATNFFVKHTVQRLDDELNSARRKTVAAQKQIHDLTAEWTYLNQPELLSDLNRRYLGLAPMSPKQIQRSVDEIPLRPVAPPPAIEIPIEPETVAASVPAPAAPVPAAPSPAMPAAAPSPIVPPVATTIARATPAPTSTPSASPIVPVAATIVARVAPATAPVASPAAPVAATRAAPVATPIVPVATAPVARSPAPPAPVTPARAPSLDALFAEVAAGR